MLLFDRGFRRVSLIDFLQQLHQRFITRLMSKVHVRGPRYRGLLSRHPLRPGQLVDLGLCFLRADDKVQTRIIGVWLRGEDQPWWLATNLKFKAEKVISIYDRRTTVEVQFRDTKGCRYAQQLKWTHFTTCPAINRLFLLAAIALAVWIVAGLLACREDRTLRLVSKKKGPRRSLVSIGSADVQKIIQVWRLSWKTVRMLLPPAPLRTLKQMKKM